MTTVSPAARLLTLESRIAHRAAELPRRAAPAVLIGSEREWDAARAATRRVLRANWAAGALGGRPFSEHLAAAATMDLPAWACATVVTAETAALIAEAADGAVAEVARTAGDTARALLVETARLGLPSGSILAVGTVIAARLDPTAIRRRISAVRAIGERGRAAVAGDDRRLTPTARRRIMSAPLHTLILVQTTAIAAPALDGAAIGCEGLLVVDAAGRIDAAISTSTMVARLGPLARGRAASRAMAVARLIGEREIELTPAPR